MGRFRSKLDTLRQTYRLCKMGGMPEPTWLAPFLKLKQAEASTQQASVSSSQGEKRTTRPQFPEDRLIQSFYSRHPNALFEAVDLASFEPPLMKKAAIRQLALIQAGMPKKEAIRTVEEDMRSKGTFKLAKPQSVLSQIQAEEERVLMAAIQKQKLKRIGGPDPA